MNGVVGVRFNIHGKHFVGPIIFQRLFVQLFVGHNFNGTRVLLYPREYIYVPFTPYHWSRMVKHKTPHAFGNTVGALLERSTAALPVIGSNPVWNIHLYELQIVISDLGVCVFVSKSTHSTRILETMTASGLNTKKFTVLRKI